MLNSYQSIRTLDIEGRTYHYYSLEAAENAGLSNIHRLPCSLKVLLENQLRYEDGQTIHPEQIQAFREWVELQPTTQTIAYRPTRVLMQDFTGVPALADLAAMREAIASLHGNPNQVNPLCGVDLVIDHSIQVDQFGHAQAAAINRQLEMQRNQERYLFFKWGQHAFQNFRVVPPGRGICHQVNLEYLAPVVQTVCVSEKWWAHPDTLVGTDSHTTMVNGLGVLGWGVGGIEAEAALLGQPIFMTTPSVVGVRLEGRLKEGVTATDLVLTITELLRQKGVVDKFVEFYGPGLSKLHVADRATLANMAPEYGATCGFFPIDTETLKYLRLTGRSPHQIALVEAYAKAQGLWYDAKNPEPIFSDTIVVSLDGVEPSMAGPNRPQDRITLSELPKKVRESGKKWITPSSTPQTQTKLLTHGDVVIAAITSCTNTSNPHVMLAAGLLAKKAVEHGLLSKPWVKTSLAPGSVVVIDYLRKANLLSYLEQLGFYLVGYGCTTCIGNSGPLPEAIAETISREDLNVAAVLSGNRNFEGRIHPLVKSNWLASPPLVVAFALAGTTNIDLTQEPIAYNAKQQPIYLKDIWPQDAEIRSLMDAIQEETFRTAYSSILKGDTTWESFEVASRDLYEWQDDSTYVKRPPFLRGVQASVPALPSTIPNACILAMLGDNVTTDHISPAGNISAKSPAGLYLLERGIEIKDFNSYGARRGNHEIMVRGTFANTRIRNEILPGIEGGLTRHFPSNEIVSIYDAAYRYQTQQVPLVIIAGKEYGTGSSRDWAAKGPALLGVKAVIAESFERIHRSNLIGMGILPLVFAPTFSRKTLQITGDETLDICNVSPMKPLAKLTVIMRRANGTTEEFPVFCHIYTENELSYYYHGGVMPFVLRALAKKMGL